MKKLARSLMLAAVLGVLLTASSCEGNVYMGVSVAGPYGYGGYGYGAPIYGGGVYVGRPFP